MSKKQKKTKSKPVKPPAKKKITTKINRDRANQVEREQSRTGGGVTLFQ